MAEAKETKELVRFLVKGTVESIDAFKDGVQLADALVIGGLIDDAIKGIVGVDKIGIELKHMNIPEFVAGMVEELAEEYDFGSDVIERRIKLSVDVLTAIVNAVVKW